MTLLKSMLMKKAGLVRDSLTASKLYVPCQGPQEKVAEFLTGLKQLFKEAYPTEQLTSTILLQRFLTGLSLKICQQLLLHGKPETLHQAVDDATAIEYALNFEEEKDDLHEISTVHHKLQPQSFKGTQKLQSSLDEIVKCLEALETHQQPVAHPQRYYDHTGGGGRIDLTVGLI